MWILKKYINRLCEDFKNIIVEQNEEYLNYLKKEAEAINEKILNK